MVPLVENGEDIEVTEDNKMKYLNLLAQHRLVRSVREETEAFLKGEWLVASSPSLSVLQRPGDRAKSRLDTNCIVIMTRNYGLRLTYVYMYMYICTLYRTK